MHKFLVALHFLFCRNESRAYAYTDLPGQRCECQHCGLVLYPQDFPPPEMYDESDGR